MPPAHPPWWRCARRSRDCGPQRSHFGSSPLSPGRRVGDLLDVAKGPGWPFNKMSKPSFSRKMPFFSTGATRKVKRPKERSPRECRARVWTAGTAGRPMSRCRLWAKRLRTMAGRATRGRLHVQSGKAATARRQLFLQDLRYWPVSDPQWPVLNPTVAWSMLIPPAGAGGGINASESHGTPWTRAWVCCAGRGGEDCWGTKAANLNRRDLAEDGRHGGEGSGAEDRRTGESC